MPAVVVLCLASGVPVGFISPSKRGFGQTHPPDLLPLVYRASVLNWLSSVSSASLSRFCMVTSPASWGLHDNVGFTFKLHAVTCQDSLQGSLPCFTEPGSLNISQACRTSIDGKWCQFEMKPGGLNQSWSTLCVLT